MNNLISLLESERLSFELHDEGYLKIKTTNSSERQRAHQLISFINNK